MTASTVTVFVCVSCKAEGLPPEEHGRAMFDAVMKELRERPRDGITVKPVECLAVCKRPCTVALSGDGKWTYVVGDVDPACHAGDVVAAAVRYAASPDGIVPWRERPLPFRKGIIARVPPLEFLPVGTP